MAGWKTYRVKWHNQHFGGRHPLRYVRSVPGGIATVKARSRDEALNKAAKRYGRGASGLIFDVDEDA